MKMKKKSIMVAFAALSMGVGANAQQSAEDGVDNLEEIVVLGSRRAEGRSIADSPVPVDVISSEQLSAIGGAVDITDSLKSLIPSYNATPLTGDGSAFVRTTSLRGLSPDQTLVLVNGKRRHRSALIQFAAPAVGAGSHAPDVAMIPSIALKNVQVLRDGAAAQYGSDAIAGVLNFELKDDSEGGAIRVQAGQHFEGEQNYQVAINKGFALGSDGFLNLSFEHIDNEALSRGIQRDEADTLIAEGVQGVGADSPFGDAPLTHTWGRPESSGTRLFFNAGVALSDNAELYTHGNYAQTEARTRFFYRPGRAADNSINSNIQTFVNNNPTLTGVDPNNPFPAGFTPYLDGDQTDFSFVGGLKGSFANDMTYDFSIGYGKNELDYFLNNTIHLGATYVDISDVQRDFDVGAIEQEETNFNADFSKALSDSLNLAFGLEFREETWSAIIGEPAAFTTNLNDLNDSSSYSRTSGFASPTPLSAGDFSRDNTALYVDLEHDVTDNWLIQYAVRAEDFSDFGSTANFKIATNYAANEFTSFRGGISTGFHAPSPGQSNVNSILTTILTSGGGSQLVEVGLVPAASPEGQEVGGQPLKEEESVSTSFGIVLDVSESTDLTLDFYKIKVNDRIYQTPNVAVDPLNPNGPSRSFFTNTLDAKSQGVDLVLTTKIGAADLALAYSYNDIEVTNVKDVITPDGRRVTPVSDSVVEDIENNFPKNRATLTSNIPFGSAWNLMVRGTYYGTHYDERGTIAGDGDPTTDDQSLQISPVLFIDAEIGFDVNDNLSFVLGANNLFDEYPDEIRENQGFANRENVGLTYPRRSVANYHGGSWYLRASYNF